MGKTQDPPKIEKLEVELNGTVVKFDVDTGADVTLIDQDTWSKIDKPKHQAASNCRVTGWGGSPINLLGRCTVHAKLENLEGTTTVYVTKKAFKPLLGKMTVRDLEMDTGPFFRYATNSVASQVATASAKTLEQVLKEIDEVFADDGGQCKQTISLKLKAGAAPRFMNCRKIPYALKPAVEQELELEVAKGILTPVERSEWATPIVVVP